MDIKYKKCYDYLNTPDNIKLMDQGKFIDLFNKCITEKDYSFWGRIVEMLFQPEFLGDGGKTILDYIPEIPTLFFYGSQLKLDKPLVIPYTVGKISESAFYYAFIKEGIKVSGPNTQLEGRCFSHCECKTIMIPEKVSVLPQGVFNESNTSSIILPTTFTKFDGVAFHDLLRVPNIVLKRDRNSLTDVEFNKKDIASLRLLSDKKLEIEYQN